jgi:hypothetical protein
VLPETSSLRAADTLRVGSAARYTVQEPAQHNALCCARAAEGGAGEEERRRDEGTEEGAKEVARAAGGEPAGAWVIGR